MNQQGNPDRTSCECKPGFVSVYDKDGVLNCKCPAGFTYEKGHCVQCGPGLYKERVGNEACNSCDKDAVRGSFSTQSTILAAATQNGTSLVPPPTSPFNCTCEKGDFLIDGPPPGVAHFSGHGHCVACPIGTDCSERGQTLTSLRLKPAYWRSHQSSRKIELCSVAEACSQANTSDGNVLFQCTDGHKGPVCSVCEHGFARDVEGVCKRCEGGGIPAKTIVIGLVITCLLLVAVALLRKRRKTKGRRIMTGKEFEVSSSFRTKFKILTSYYQIVSQYEDVFQVRFPKLFEAFSRRVSSIFNLNLLQLGSVDCFVETSFYTKLIFMTLGPVLITFLIFIMMWIRRALTKDRMKRKVVRDNCIELFLGLTFMVFSGSSTTIFDTFNCRTFGEDPTMYLNADRGISCDNPRHQDYKKFAFAMMTLFPIGIPLLYAAMLYQRRHEIQSTMRYKKDSLIKTSFLWEMYEPSMWWFEVFDCFRRLAMASLLVFVKPGSASQIVVAMILAMCNSKLLRVGVVLIILLISPKKELTPPSLPPPLSLPSCCLHTSPTLRTF